jgi:hypothetical protein
MGKNDEREMMNKALDAYEQSTGDTPDTRDYVKLEELVHDYVEKNDG